MKRIMILLMAGAMATHPSHAENTGQNDCLKLSVEEIAWFNLGWVRRCCSVADGYATRYEHRPDGYYIPAKGAEDYCTEKDRDHPADEDHAAWVLVPEQLVVRLPNGIGHAVVWWINDGSEHPPIRCFVPLAEG